MTDNEKRIAIAEACPHVFCIFPESGDIGRWLDEEGTHVEDCDPLKSLDSMQAAVTAQSEEFQSRFAAVLYRKSKPDEYNSEIPLIHQLTPRDWAEAFVEVKREMEQKG